MRVCRLCGRSIYGSVWLSAERYADLPLYDYGRLIRFPRYGGYPRPCATVRFTRNQHGSGAFFGKVGSFENGYEFDAVIMDDGVLPHPQELTLAECMERAVYLGSDEKISPIGSLAV